MKSVDVYTKMDQSDGSDGSYGKQLQPSNISILPTDEEMKYRKKLFPEPSSVLKTTVRCTACGTSLLKDVRKGLDIFFHPILQVLVCEECRIFYGDGNFALDEDKSDTYCRWCAQGGSLYCCSACNFVFCKPCIRRNFKKSMLEEIEEEDWKCFVCNPESLWKHRAICWAARELIKNVPRGDDDEIDSSNDERQRMRRVTARQKKWGRRRNVQKERKLPTKKNRPPRHSSEGESMSEDEDSRCVPRKGGQGKEKLSVDGEKSGRRESEKCHVQAQRRRRKEENDDDDDDSEDDRHKCEKSQEKHRQKKEKGLETVVGTLSPETGDSDDNECIITRKRDSDFRKRYNIDDEDARQIFVMKKTCQLMQKLTRDSQLVAHSTSRKMSQLHRWLYEKNKSHQELPTSPAKLNRLMESYKKILHRLTEHTNNLQMEFSEVEIEWLNVVEGKKEGLADESKEVDIEQEEENRVNGEEGHEKTESDQETPDVSAPLNGHVIACEGVSSPEKTSMRGESTETNGCRTGDKEGNLDHMIRASEGKVCLHKEVNDGENPLEDGRGLIASKDEEFMDQEKKGRNDSADDTETLFCSQETLLATVDVEGDGGEMQMVTKDPDTHECKEKEVTPPPDSESDISKTSGNKCSEREGNDESGREVESSREEYSCMPVEREGGKERDGSEGEEGAQGSSKSGGKCDKTSENDVSVEEVIEKDPSEGDLHVKDKGKDLVGTEQCKDNETAAVGEEISQPNKSIQDMFDSDVECDVNISAAFAHLSGDSAGVGSGGEAGGDTGKSAKETVADKSKEAVSDKNDGEGNSRESDIKCKGIKASKDDRDAKMAFLLDTSSSSCDATDSEKAVKRQKRDWGRIVCSENSEVDSEMDGDSSGGIEVKEKNKKLVGKFSVSTLLSQHDDRKLKAGCFVSLKRIESQNCESNGLEPKKKRNSDNLMRAIDRLGNLADLENKRSKKSRSDNDDRKKDLSTKGKRLTKKIKKSKDAEDEVHKDSSDDDELSSDDAVNVDGSQKFSSKNNTKSIDALAAELLAKSSPSDSLSSGSDDESKVKKKTGTKATEEKREEEGKKEEESERKTGGGDDDDGSSSDLEVIASRKSWRRDRLLHEKLSVTDSSEDWGEKQRSKKKKKDRGCLVGSSEEERRWTAKKKKVSESDSEDESGSITPKARKKKVQRRLASSNSDISEVSSSAISCDSSDFEEKINQKKRKAKLNSSEDNTSGSKIKFGRKKKRRRIKVPTSDSDKNIEDKDEEKDKEASKHNGRKSKRKVLKGKQLAEETKAAAKDEAERLKRIAERQRLYNEMFTDTRNLETLDELVLDFDPDTKKPLVSVDPVLVKKMKPHQVEGVKFMWEACFESLKMIEEGKGSGSILAHCMGLGKTLQVIALVHSLLSNPKTKVNTVLVICPLNTVLNWVNEFKIWLKDVGSGSDVEVFELSRYKLNAERKYHLKDWYDSGGVMIMGYNMYRNLSNATNKKIRQKIHEVFQSTLVDPGPDLVICDEGHLLKNIASALSKAVNSMKTSRRIVLTGTPLQNNLKEYYCMIQFVKPNLLGTPKEFHSRFVSPITNGQLAESTPHDVRVMKRRAHVLHKMLEGCVQRQDYSVLTPFLPPKREYVICIQLTELQSKLYQYYLDNLSRKSGGTSLFNDFQNLQRIWTHPRLLKISAEIQEKKRIMQSDSEGSLKDFIDDDESTTTLSSSDSDDSKPQRKMQTRRKNYSSSSNSDIVCLSDDKNDKNTKVSDDEKKGGTESPLHQKEWWENFVMPEDHDKLEHSGKLVLLFDILQKCELIGDKILVFSQSLYSLDVIEYFLEKIDDLTQKIGTQSTEEGTQNKDPAHNFLGSWTKGLDYFRIDGSVSGENRSIWCKSFNKKDNLRARLFLISTRAGGMGINLIGANRVILFDASWNPSNDLQSIFRIYRFGQNKPCYVYRFLAQATMEEKIYNRQVTKLSLALRVVDEQQIERHFNLDDLQELYRYEPNMKAKRPTPILPKDRLLAELIQKYADLIDNYHEHDSLLENKTEEELTEEERVAAWEEFENDKKEILPETNFAVGGINAYGEMLSSVYKHQMYGGTAVLFDAVDNVHPNASEEQVAHELNVATKRISQYFTNPSYPQLQQFYNAHSQQMQNNPGMGIYPTMSSNYSQLNALLQTQFGLQNYNQRPLVPTLSVNNTQMLPHGVMPGLTPHMPPKQPPPGIQLQANGDAGPSVPKLKIRSDLMPPSDSTVGDNDIIVEAVKRREN